MNNQTSDELLVTIASTAAPLRLSGDRVTAIQSDMLFWTIVDGILLVTIISGNTLTILALRFSRRLRSIISNMFVLSLAISDMVVGLTLPYHLAFYLGSDLGASSHLCLLRFFLIILACCVSIWNLIAIAVDRYIAIVYPLHYGRYMTRRVAFILISVGWVLGATIAAIPMFWNNYPTATECEFDQVLPPWYMAGVVTPTFSMVWLCMLLLYWRIWREAAKHVKQLRSSCTGLQEGASDWKSVQVVLLILGCFSVCWLPYFIVACAQIFNLVTDSSPTLYKGAFSLAMANSGMNPIIYAWKNTNFRRAFGRLLRCQLPDVNDRQSGRPTNSSQKKASLQSSQRQSMPNATNGGAAENNNNASVAMPPTVNAVNGTRDSSVKGSETHSTNGRANLIVNSFDYLENGVKSGKVETVICKVSDLNGRQ